MNPDEIRSDDLEESEELEETEPDNEPYDDTDDEPEEEVPALDPPLFSVNTVIDAKIQQEASEAVAAKSAKYVSYGCLALVILAFGFLVYQYIVARSTSSLVLMIGAGLVVAYLIYSQITMPKKALERWEASIRRSFGASELHVTTEFYPLSLAQTVKEDGSVNVQGYSELSDLRESEHLFLLRRTQQQWFFVAKDGFTAGTADEFRKFISERIPTQTKK